MRSLVDISHLMRTSVLYENGSTSKNQTICFKSLDNLPNAPSAISIRKRNDSIIAFGKDFCGHKNIFQFYGSCVDENREIEDDFVL